MIYFIYLIIMVAFIDTFSQLPIMSPFADSLGASSLIIGLVVGMYSFSNMFGNILAGYWIDKEGSKKLLSFGLIVTGAIILAYTIVTSPGQLLVVRFFHGFSGGFLVPAAFTFLSNIEKDGNKRGKTMAISGAAVGISAIIGPAFGGIVTSNFGINWVFLTIAILMIIVGIIATVSLPKSEMVMTRRMDKASLGSLTALLKSPALIISYLGAFSLMFSQGVLAYMLPLKVEILQYGPQYSGMLLSTFAIVSILIFILPTNKVFDSVSHVYTMTAGLGLLSCALFLLSNVTSLGAMFAVMAVYGIGFALLFPSINAYIIENTTMNDRGKAFGLFYAFFSLGVVVGSFIIGALKLTADESFILGAIVLIVMIIVISLLGKLQNRK